MAITYVDALEVAINAVADAEVAEKLSALKAQVAKRHSSSKPTKTQVANEGIKEQIISVLADCDEGVTVKEILGLLDGDYTSQKISALLRQLVTAGKVVKSTEKKVSRFALA